MTLMAKLALFLAVLAGTFGMIVLALVALVILLTANLPPDDGDPWA